MSSRQYTHSVGKYTQHVHSSSHSNSFNMNYQGLPAKKEEETNEKQVLSIVCMISKISYNNSPNLKLWY